MTVTLMERCGEEWFYGISRVVQRSTLFKTKLEEGICLKDQVNSKSILKKTIQSIFSTNGLFITPPLHTEEGSCSRCVTKESYLEFIMGEIDKVVDVHCDWAKKEQKIDDAFVTELFNSQKV